MIERWAAERSLPVQKAGRLTLTIDGKYRVRVSEAPNRRVVFESRICDLPADRLERDRLIERVLQTSTGRMRSDGAVLSVDPLEAALLLQAEMSVDTDEQGLGDAVAGFVNSLSFWSKVV